MALVLDHPAPEPQPDPAPADDGSSRRRFRAALGVVAGIVSLVLLAPVLGHVYSAMGSLRTAQTRWVVVALVCETTTFVTAWALQRLVLRTDGWRVVAVPQMVGNAASNVLPAGSALGTVLQLRLLSKNGIDLTRSTVSLAFTGLLTTVAGLVVFPFIALLPVGTSTDVSTRDAVPIALALLVACAVLFVVALRSDRPMERLARGCQNTLQRISWIRPPADLATRIVRERDAVREALRRRPVYAATMAIGRSVGDYLALYAVLFAFGLRPGPAVVLFAFMAANAAGMVPFTPGGLGFVEAGLTGALVLAGAGTEQSLAAVAIYRLISCWLPVAAGLLAYLWSTARPCQPTAPAPTSGPSRPNPAGTIRAPRAKDSRATASSSD